LTLRDKWKSGISAYLGCATHGFPNILFLYGPQAPAGLSNGPSSAELQGDEIVELLKFMKGNGRSRLESSDQADKAWRERIDQYCVSRGNGDPVAPSGIPLVLALALEIRAAVS
jgi:hypothetical protein